MWTFLCTVHRVQVTLQKLDKGGNISSEQHRSHVGTTYFEAGTTVNDVLTFISERQRKTTGGTGLWLLQTSGEYRSVCNSFSMHMLISLIYISVLGYYPLHAYDENSVRLSGATCTVLQPR